MKATPYTVPYGCVKGGCIMDRLHDESWKLLYGEYDMNQSNSSSSFFYYSGEKMWFSIFFQAYYNVKRGRQKARNLIKNVWEDGRIYIQLLYIHGMFANDLMTLGELLWWLFDVVCFRFFAIFRFHGVYFWVYILLEIV